MKKLYGYAPLDCGYVHYEGLDEMCFYQYMPVKLPSESIVIPKHMQRFTQFVYDCAENFDTTYGVRDYDNSYIYLTAKTLWVNSGNPGNRPGWHSDGFMTDDINYVWSDANPTVFWVPDTPVELPQDHITSMDVMEDYAELDFEHHIRYPNCSILRLDESVIHKVDTDIDAGMRTFLKLSFSTEVYALKGNAINPDLKLDATYKDRTKQRNCPTGVHIEDTCDASS